jgi:hypothetical protein
MRPSLLAVLALATASCTASLDLDKYKKADALAIDSASITYFDIGFSAKNMQSHLGEYMEWRLVDKANAVQAKIVYVGVTRPDFKLELPKVIPKGNAPYRLDWWADHNDSGRYDGIVGGINDKDHAWRRVFADPLPDDVKLTGSRYDVSFLHDTAFVDIFTDLDGNTISGADELLALRLDVQGAGAWVGKTIEIHVVDKGSGRLVAVHRQGKAPASYPATVTGVLDEETDYQVSAWVDDNDDDAYTAGEPSWQTDITSTAAGVVAQLNLATLTPTPIGELQ